MLRITSKALGPYALTVVIAVLPLSNQPVSLFAILHSMHAWSLKLGSVQSELGNAQPCTISL